jgi:DNA-binding MarR family transcriptional regulator
LTDPSTGAGRTRQAVALRFSDEPDPLLDAVQGVARRLVALTASALLQSPGTGSVTLPEYRVLVLIALGRVTAPSDLATELDVSRAAVAQILGRLSSKRLIRRGAHGEDRRRSVLSVTPKGRQVVQAVVRERGRRLRPALAQLSTTERSELLRALDRLQRALA